MSSIIADNVEALAMLGLQSSFRPNKSTVNEQKTHIMNLSTKEIGQPKQATNRNSAVECSSVSPSIANAHVIGGLSSRIKHLKKRLLKVEKELDKCRTSTIQDGWQTQRFAKKSRKWDYYAQEKMKLIGLIEDAEKLEWIMDVDND